MPTNEIEMFRGPTQKHTMKGKNQLTLERILLPPVEREIKIITSLKA